LLLNFKQPGLLIKIFIFLFSLSFTFSQGGRVNHYGEVNPNHVISGEDYITNDDGTLLMYVNVWGHVKNPGTYLVYEGIDLLTLISLAGGPDTGANLNNIRIIHDKDKDQVSNINLNKYIKKNRKSIQIKPHDTIYIKESMGSYLFTRVNLVSTVLQIANIYYTVSRIQ
tara:strand:+ start:138 stop:644 length:507 start_codon:yes stop_codon:yes gene_type:complete